MTRSKKPRKKPDPETLLAKLRKLDVAVAMTLRTDISRMYDAAARRYLQAKLSQMRRGEYRRPWWLVDGASSTGHE